MSHLSVRQTLRYIQSAPENQHGPIATAVIVEKNYTPEFESPDEFQFDGDDHVIELILFDRLEAVVEYLKSSWDPGPYGLKIFGDYVLSDHVNHIFIMFSSTQLRDQVHERYLA